MGVVAPEPAVVEGVGSQNLVMRLACLGRLRREGSAAVVARTFFAEKEASLRNTQRRSKLVAGFIALAMLAALGGAAAAGPALGTAVTPMRGNPTDIVQVAVELHEEPTAVVYRRHLDLHSMKVAASTAAVGHLYVVENEQADFRARLAQARITGLAESFSLQRTFNGIVYVTTRSTIEALKKIPGVKAVHEMPALKLDNAHGIPFVGAPGIWEGLGLNLHGEGIKLGVIDTGLDFIHTNFGGSGDPAVWTANDTSDPPAVPVAGKLPKCTTRDANFPTKVGGGIDLAGATYNLGASPPVMTILPDCDPMDFHGHGTHVAGTATGFGVKADGTTYTGPWNATTDFAGLRIGPGVAPLATLYPIKIIGDNDTGSSTLISAAVEWAVDPDQDGNFSDRLDVVNISFGGPFGVEDITTVVYRNAVLAGMILCMSAGNSMDVWFVTGSPASTPEVISVAATMHDHNTAATVQVNTPAGVGPFAANNAAFGPAPGAGVTGDLSLTTPTNGCTDPSEDLTGKIALIDRGVCAFTVKVKAAQNKGAIGVVVANNTGGTLSMGGSDPTITIPSVSITQAAGNALKTALAAGTVNVTLVDAPQTDNIVYFSSRGPSRSGYHAVLKPDIAAPGYQILSSVPYAYMGTDMDGEAWSGTSMAAPHMTGVMALLRQYHPTWTPAELKALVMNTATHDIYLNSIDNPRKRIGPGRVGAGRVDLTTATAGSVLAYDAAHPERVSLSFDTIDVVGQVTETRQIQLKNKDATDAVTYNITIDPAVECDGATVSLPGVTQVTVPANASINVPVALVADSATMIRRHDATVDEYSILRAGYPRFWVAEQSGWIVFTPTGAGAEPTLRVPFYAVLNPASDMAAESPLATTGTTGTADLTLAGTGLNTLVTSTTDSYPSAPLSMVSALELLYTSPEGPPLQGAPFPAGFDPANTDGADLKYVGVTSNLVDVAGDLDNTWVYFGIVAHGPWGAPTDVLHRVLVRRASYTPTPTAPFEYSVEVYDYGYAPASGYSGDNLNLSAVWDLVNGGGYLMDYINAMPADGLYVPAFMTDSIVLPVLAPYIGVSSGDSIIQIQVETYSNSTSYDTWQLVDLTPVLRYDVANPGFQVAADTSTDLPAPFNTGLWPPFQKDLPGTFPVQYELDNAKLNGAGGLLLIHWLNGLGARGQKVDVDGLTCLTNADCPAYEKQFCDVATGTCVGCITNAECRFGEWCDMYNTRTCIVDCTASWGNACAPGAFCNESTLQCVNDCRWQGAEPCAAGSYCNTQSGLCVVANALVKQSPEPAGTHCPNGGVKIESGIDDDGDLVLDPAEVDQTSYVCNGLPTLVKAVDIPAGTGPCANGGQIIYAGVDDNADGVLQESEHDTFWYACNGLDGHNTLLKVTDEAPGSNCAAGGKKVETGVDDNADGVLQAGEVDHMEYVCNGGNGADGKQALVSVTDEEPGDNCAAGGKKIEAGIDGNSDGVLQAGEVDQTTYVCNGNDGETGNDGEAGATTLVESSPLASGSSDCPKGGVLIKTGVDQNGDGRLDADEVTSTTAVCNGEKGSGCSAAPTAASAGPLGLLLLLGLLVLRRKQ
jgi:MYXO-CTERM domain-containing protein